MAHTPAHAHNSKRTASPTKTSQRCKVTSKFLQRLESFTRDRQQLPTGASEVPGPAKPTVQPNFNKRRRLTVRFASFLRQSVSWCRARPSSGASCLRTFYLTGRTSSSTEKTLDLRHTNVLFFLIFFSFLLLLHHNHYFAHVRNRFRFYSDIYLHRIPQVMEISTENIFYSKPRTKPW